MDLDTDDIPVIEFISYTFFKLFFLKHLLDAVCVIFFSLFHPES